MELTRLQKEAVKKFTDFVVDPNQTFFVISGYAGTGKTTLVNTLIKELPSLLETVRILLNETFTPEVYYTATTHKAVESLTTATGVSATTIHSLLGIVIEWDSKTFTHKMIPTGRGENLDHSLVFIDEASYVNDELFRHIKRSCASAKVVFIGDPAQLLSPKCIESPVFGQGYPEARLTEVMRQAKGNPIQDLSTVFREAVSSRNIGGIQIDQDRIRHVPKNTFLHMVKAEFTRADWDHNDSRILACTNKVVEEYNRGLRELITGNRGLQPGMQAVSNSHVKLKKGSIKNNAFVHIQSAHPYTQQIQDQDFPGTSVSARCGDSSVVVFVPDDPRDQMRALRLAGDEYVYPYHPESWADFRAVYASTVHKSQGSTYNRVFIDLDDMKKIRDPSDLARLLYVGVSRAREQVILTGDIR